MAWSDKMVHAMESHIPLICAACLLAGCAVNGTGATAMHVTPADGAIVADLYTLGLQLRTRDDDEGLAFGLGRRAYVFDAVDAGEMAPGWHFFHAGLPPQNAVAVYRSNFGLNIYREVDRVGVTLGLRSGATLAAIPSDQTAVIDIDFEPNAPELTRLRYCFGEAACDSFFSDR
jgi:hypothetical protein